MSRVFRQVMTGLVSIVRRVSELLLTASGEEKASVRGFAGRGEEEGGGCGRAAAARHGAAALHAP